MEMEEQVKLKPNLIEMAKKRRHLHLVEKLARGKSATPTLSKAEIHELERYEGDPATPGVVDSREKVAKIFGVAWRTVERWVKDGMPITPDKKYDLLDIRAWREFKKRRNNKSGKKNNLQDRKDTADATYREYKAKLAEIALKKVIGELIPRDIVEKELIQISIGIKRALLALPQQVAPQLVGLEARKIDALLTARIKEVIEAIADGKALVNRIKNGNPTGNIKALDASSS
ncbi:MAG: hypothetical protein PHC54_05410 [Candidatus Omnitrophica bacterium]|nr:hypothetical protein [Candidatus Omnitrophota bacterium]MDD5592662.1 hypothetical protein [Candidatus Omnitrophota bacterium]